MRRCRYRPTLRGFVAALVVLTMLLLAGYIEVHAQTATVINWGMGISTIHVRPEISWSGKVTEEQRQAMIERRPKFKQKQTMQAKRVAIPKQELAPLGEQDCSGTNINNTCIK